MTMTVSDIKLRLTTTITNRLIFDKNIKIRNYQN